MKDISGYEGRYAVTEDGRVWSYPRHGVRKGRWLKPGLSSGYLLVSLCGGTQNPKTQLVHRLVALTYLPNPNNLACVCHKDDNHSNNQKDNLWWGSHQDNTQDMVDKGRQAKGGQTRPKLKEEDVLYIRQRSKTVKELSEQYKVSLFAIYNVLNRRTWRHI